METLGQRKFSSPEEEIAFLRDEIARRERDLLSRNREIDHADHETIGKQVVREYAEHDPSTVLEKKHALSAHALTESHHIVEVATHKVEEIMRVAIERGVRNALSVLEKIGDPFLTDEVHRSLIELLRRERKVADLDESGPLWEVLHMTLFEISLPRHPDEEHTARDLKSIFFAMEQFYAGMLTLSRAKVPHHYTLEIAVSDKRDDIIFYVAVPNEFINLFEKQALSLFPHAVLVEQKNDYNVFVDRGVSLVSVLYEHKHPLYPIKLHDSFEHDPLSVLLNAFSKIERDGGGAAIQIVIAGGTEKYQKKYGEVIHRIEHGESTEIALRKSSVAGEVFEGIRDLFSVSTNTQEDKPREINSEKVELFNTKLHTPIVSTNIRLVVSAVNEHRAGQILTELESTFHQFQNTRGNRFEFNRLGSTSKTRELRAFSFREYNAGRSIPLSLAELATIMHFPAEGVESSPQFKQSRAKHAPAPVDIPAHGTLLGENEFRNHVRKIYLTPEDRLRHFYVIGQTGTGKSTLLTNMIVQDIRDGAGVCMMDPHGKDIIDVLSAVPPERLEDVIYFDPANMERTIGLNMLEYDPRFPEQKTFVVNELFSMFQKLYGANPESMGPMFEQYFRNSAMLVMEDPESGSTLLDISRVMADAQYRNHKLSKATNPVVKQFWEKIATKAGGEQSLENFVPYITSKIDPLTANDYMRPIIGQQRSTFNFRELMDSQKILLVNLSKGKLGEINANLIGMIVVGKILMAALSRVDDVGKSLPPFYLYIDEFQNVTTNSISAILSEARKYKLGLTVAHQFIAQLDENIRDAVFGNVGSVAAFRVGSEDAQVLVRQFDPVFSENDLMNIENYYTYVRLLMKGTPAPPFSVHITKPHETDHEYAKQIIEYSLLKHGTPRHVIDAEIKARYL